MSKFHKGGKGVPFSYTLSILIFLISEYLQSIFGKGVGKRACLETIFIIPILHFLTNGEIKNPITLFMIGLT